ncbi:MAG: c-type cytochrome [Woeseiaceae bacterium]
MGFFNHSAAICYRSTQVLAGILAVLIVLVVSLGAPEMAFAEVQLVEKDMTWRQARLTHGEDLYEELCAVCHGQSGKGDGPAISALKQVPTDLTALAARNNGEFPFEVVEQFVSGKARIAAHGTDDMPIWGRAFEYTKPDWNRVRRIKFAQHRIHNIVEYIESLQIE